MKFKITTITSLLLAMSVASGYANVQVQGINYDPSGSLLFQKGVGTNNIPMMQEAIENDLNLIPQINQAARQNMNINHIKTFFSVYTSADGSNPLNSLNIADVINDWNLKHPTTTLQLALGVYEFRPETDSCSDDATCEQWTQVQVNAAIFAANKYGHNLIDRIVVGNEDIDAGSPQTDLLRTRILNDIKNIKGQLKDTQIKVGTAQMSGTVLAMLAPNAPANLAAVLNVSDFIGSNEYPFWGGIDYGQIPYSNSPAKQAFESYWSQINKANTNNKEIISTEEGWPSAGNTNGMAIPSQDHEHDYIYYFGNRPSNVVPVAYIFALKDLLQKSKNDPNSNWGIYSQDGFSSVLNPDGTVGNKVLDTGHVIVNVNNQVRNNNTGKLRLTQLVACLNSYQYPNTNNTCYPINGYPGSGNLDNNTPSKQFLIDTTGNTYKSLLATYQGDDPTQPQYQLCYVDSTTLNKLTNNSTINFQWINQSGNAPCVINFADVAKK